MMLSRKTGMALLLMLLGAALGSGGIYLWLSSRTSPVSQGNGTGPVVPADPPEPSAQEARAALEAVLKKARIDAHIHQFEQTGCERAAAEQNATGHKSYCVSYRADVEFRHECAVRENATFLWSAWNRAGDGVAVIVDPPDTKTFRPGERVEARGLIRWALVDGVWQVWKDGTRIETVGTAREAPR
jgi:hypothetical protein